MAKDKLTEYSATNASNDVIGDISVAEGMLPSAVNNALREQMTHLKNFSDGTDAIDALAVDNLKLDGNTISSTDTNGDITIDPDGTGVVSVAGDMTFGDNDKAIFGAGSDLQIYHDGSNSKIQEIGTGNLFIDTTDALTLRQYSTNSVTAKFVGGGASELYHNNSKKMETTSGGIDVTGTVTADAATIDNGVLTVNDTGTRKVEISGNGFVYFTNNPVLDGGIEFTNQFGHVFSAGVSSSNNFDVLNGATKIARFAGGGDISFYDSTGTTQGLFWDASTQRLGLGTTAPASLLHLDQGSGGEGLRFERDSYDTMDIELSESGFRIRNETDGRTDFFIDGGGSVGIGTASPTEDLHIKGKDGAHADVIIQAYTGYNSGLNFNDNAGMAGRIVYNHSNNFMEFDTNGSEAVRIDSSQNLLVGTTSPVTVLRASTTEEGIAIQPNGQFAMTAAETTAGVALGYFNRRSSDGQILQFRKDGATVGSISVTGSGTTYNTTSDSRLKSNIEDATSASDKIDAIQVRQFDWNVDNSHQDYGLIAQELQTVEPLAVSGDADSEEMMTVDYSKLVPMLIKEIQELRSRVATLEAN
jgi:hypothetical protein